jgi:hypothetical protein
VFFSNVLGETNTLNILMLWEVVMLYYVVNIRLPDGSEDHLMFAFNSHQDLLAQALPLVSPDVIILSIQPWGSETDHGFDNIPTQ